MAKKEKEAKEYTVKRSSIGTALVFKGKKVILNNGLPQTTLKAMFTFGFKAILKASK
jgi:hypothetical protein